MKLKSLCQLFRESTLRALILFSWPLVFLACAPIAVESVLRRACGLYSNYCGWCSYSNQLPGLRRLRWVCAKETIFERCTIKPADDGIHLFGIRSINEGESLRFLCFRVADYLDSIRNQAFCGKPRLNIVSGYPDGDISEKYSKAHSLGLFTPWGFSGPGSSRSVRLKQHHTSTLECKWEAEKTRKAWLSCWNGYE